MLEKLYERQWKVYEGKRGEMLDRGKVGGGNPE